MTLHLVREALVKMFLEKLSAQAQQVVFLHVNKSQQCVGAPF